MGSVDLPLDVEPWLSKTSDSELTRSQPSERMAATSSGKEHPLGATDILGGGVDVNPTKAGMARLDDPAVSQCTQLDGDFTLSKQLSQSFVFEGTSGSPMVAAGGASRISWIVSKRQIAPKRPFATRGVDEQQCPRIGNVGRRPATIERFG
ncbi:hypothetical protein [Bradyrhizobium sp. BTAi1]|uniref:hypothetical protein n=1 Tax=Bradyrhizobium sp. (strain BTAi1 / ATCC BAA-1182) TaxID=288000 RepID=UPI0011D11E3C|nr:hypothetical protein [Bradyrhizobium sp. BTAi1]